MNIIDLILIYGEVKQWFLPKRRTLIQFMQVYEIETMGRRQENALKIIETNV